MNSLKYNKTLLVVGAGVFQTYAIKTAKNLGLKVLTLDFDENAPGRFFADDFIKVSTRDIPGAIKACEIFKRKHGLNGVITCGTDVSQTVSTIAEYFKLPGVSKETALMTTNKGEMRKALKAAAIPVPEFIVTESIQDAEKFLEKISSDLVIKPVDSMGARGVRKISSMKDLSEAFPLALQNSLTGKVILEEYIPGPEISMDTLVYNGKTHLLTIADRHISGEPYFIERGHTIPSQMPADKLDEAFKMAERAVKAMGIEKGPSKFDMKISPSGPVIGEMTSRLSGGFHSQVTDPLATGMNTIKAVIDVALGYEPDMRDITPLFHKAACERSIYPEPGKVISINGVEEARLMPGIHEIHINCLPGDNLLPIVSNIGKAGHVIASGKTIQEAAENAENARDFIKIETTQL